MCKFCEGNVDDRESLIVIEDCQIGDTIIYIDGNCNLSIGDDAERKINFCPECGRKFNEDEKYCCYDCAIYVSNNDNGTECQGSDKICHEFRL